MSWMADSGWLRALDLKASAFAAAFLACGPSLASPSAPAPTSELRWWEPGVRTVSRKLLVVAAAATLFGCTSTSMVPVRVTSTPPGAQVDVDGVSMGSTPVQVSLSCSRRWVGVLNAPDGWAYDASTFEITIYPSSQRPGYSQTKRINPCQWAGPGSPEVKFDVGLESVSPTQKIEIR
jgi:hypothetical protein